MKIKIKKCVKSNSMFQTSHSVGNKCFSLLFLKENDFIRDCVGTLRTRSADKFVSLTVVSIFINSCTWTSLENDERLEVTNISGMGLFNVMTKTRLLFKRIRDNFKIDKIFSEDLATTETSQNSFFPSVQPTGP
jgi:hypothetical protein